jgi:hypothetical protein
MRGKVAEKGKGIRGKRKGRCGRVEEEEKMNRGGFDHEECDGGGGVQSRWKVGG